LDFPEGQGMRKNFNLVTPQGQFSGNRRKKGAAPKGADEKNKKPAVKKKLEQTAVLRLNGEAWAKKQNRVNAAKNTTGKQNGGEKRVRGNWNKRLGEKKKVCWFLSGPLKPSPLGGQRSGTEPRKKKNRLRGQPKKTKTEILKQPEK